MNAALLNITTSDGKYTCIQEESGAVSWLHYGMQWFGAGDTHEWAPPKAALALAYDLEEERLRNAELLRAIVEMAIPYEGIRADSESRKWIAPEIWDHIVEATETARALLPKVA